MSVMLVKPWLLPRAKILADAIKASDKDYPAIGRAVGVSANTIRNRATGRSRVTLDAARQMAAVLGCAWEPLVSPEQPPRAMRRKGRPKGGKNKPRAPGPAARALALHEAATPLQTVLAPPTNGRHPAPAPAPVLGFELYSDGTSHIALKASLPADRGSALLRQLLDFGLVQT